MKNDILNYKSTMHAVMINMYILYFLLFLKVNSDKLGEISTQVILHQPHSLRKDALQVENKHRFCMSGTFWQTTSRWEPIEIIDNKVTLKYIWLLVIREGRYWTANNGVNMYLFNALQSPMHLSSSIDAKIICARIKCGRSLVTYILPYCVFKY